MLNIKKLKQKDGTSLIEVMMATLILSVVLVGIISAFIRAKVYATEVKEYSIVNNVLKEEMEEIRGTAYSSILTMSTTLSSNGLSGLDGASASLILENTFTDDDIRKATITIDWTSELGRTKSRSLTSYVTNNGISGN